MEYIVHEMKELELFVSMWLITEIQCWARKAGSRRVTYSILPFTCEVFENVQGKLRDKCVGHSEHWAGQGRCMVALTVLMSPWAGWVRGPLPCALCTFLALIVHGTFLLENCQATRVANLFSSPSCYKKFIRYNLIFFLFYLSCKRLFPFCPLKKLGISFVLLPLCLTHFK